MFHFKWLEYLIEIYLQPVLACMGVLTNLLNVILCERMRRQAKLTKNVMYKHMYANSLFSLLYCLIRSLSLINTCIFPANSFCSSVLKTKSAQYFKIIVGLFACNTIKLCSNFSYISFSTSRLFLSGANQSTRFHRFEKFNLKLYYALVCVFSSLLSTPMLFKYKPNEYYSSFDKNFPYDAYGINYCNIAPFRVESFVTLCRMFPILDMINNVLNSIVFMFVSLLLDACLFKAAGETLRRKKDLLRDVTHLEEAVKCREHITWFVLLNSLIFFCSHVPEFVTQILLLVYARRLSDFCYYYFSCSKILEMSQAANLVAISVSFFIYHKFDKNFRESFASLVKNAKRK